MASPAKCFFVDDFMVLNCPYMTEDNYCDDIITGPYNSDAWCQKAVSFAHDAKILLTELKEVIESSGKAE